MPNSKIVKNRTKTEITQSGTDDKSIHTRTHTSVTSKLQLVLIGINGIHVNFNIKYTAQQIDDVVSSLWQTFYKCENMLTGMTVFIFFARKHFNVATAVFRSCCIIGKDLFHDSFGFPWQLRDTCVHVRHAQKKIDVHFLRHVKTLS